MFGLCIYYIINLLIKNRLTEQFVPNDNRNSHYFLTNAMIPGKKDITNLKEYNHSIMNNYSYVGDFNENIEKTDPNVVTHRQSILNRDGIICIDNKSIQKYKPSFLKNNEIINLYDFPFYHDWRYPERPIDVNFAINPKYYCLKNPEIYPCYKWM